MEYGSVLQQGAAVAVEADPTPPRRASRSAALVAGALALLCVGLVSASTTPRSQRVVAAAEASPAGARAAPTASATLAASSVSGAAAAQSMSVATKVETNSAAVMKLHAEVQVTLSKVPESGAPYTVAVMYAPTGARDRLAPLWTANVSFTSNSSSGAEEATIDVYRLRPGTEYEFHVWLSEVHRIMCIRRRMT